MAATNSHNGSGPPTVVVEPLALQPLTTYNIPMGQQARDKKIAETLEEYDIPTLQGENEKWGVWAVYVIWIAYVCIQLFRPELTDNYAVPEAVCDVLESGAMASLALTWDQLVAGPRRTRTARMEASINAKLDMQSRDADTRGQSEAQMLARIEVNEKAQAQLVRTEGLLAEKLEQEMQALVSLQQRLSSLSVNRMMSGAEASTSSSPASSSSSSIDTSILIDIDPESSVDMSSMRAEVKSATVTPGPRDGSNSLTLSLQITLTPSRNLTGVERSNANVNQN